MVCATLPFNLGVYNSAVKVHSFSVPQSINNSHRIELTCNFKHDLQSMSNTSSHKKQAEKQCCASIVSRQTTSKREEKSE